MSAPGPRCPRDGGEPYGVEIRAVYDGILFWACLRCDTAWERNGLQGARREHALQEIQRWNADRCEP